MPYVDRARRYPPPQFITARATGSIVAILALAFFTRECSIRALNVDSVSWLLTLLAAALAGGNAIRTNRENRIFWSLLAAGFVVWALEGWPWNHRSPTVADSVWLEQPRFLHTALFTGAVILRAHATQLRGKKLYQEKLDLLPGLFVWTFAYAYTWIPYRHEIPVGHAMLYLFENVALILVLGSLISRTTDRWRRFYSHLLGATVLYTLSSLVANFFGCSQDDSLSICRIPLAAAIGWYAWAMLIGWRVEPELQQEPQPSQTYSQVLSAFFNVGLIAIPLTGLWELLRSEDNTNTKVFRLSIVLLFMLLVSFYVVTKNYVERGDLVHHLPNTVCRGTQVETERVELSGRLIEAQEEERKRIGRELHDDLNQRLGSLAFGLALLGEKAEGSGLKEKIQELWEETTSLSRDVHRLSHELHPAWLENLGLPGAARALCEESSRQRALRIEFLERNLPARLDPDISVCLFRILQECLNNVFKHSQARLVEVTLIGLLDRVYLRVQDDGLGFDTKNKCIRPGLGLLSMRERVRLAGGQIAIDAAPHQGTVVEVWIPGRVQIAPIIPILPPSERPHMVSQTTRGRDETRTGTFGR